VVSGECLGLGEGKVCEKSSQCQRCVISCSINCFSSLFLGLLSKRK
jgi:hypothetical protein